MTTSNKTASKKFKLGSLVIPVSVTIDDVIDYNDEYNFHEGDEGYTPNWVCANVTFVISEKSGFGQVQYDNQNKCYSADCDGNGLGDDIKDTLLSQFTKEMLDEYGFSDDPEELRDGLEYEVLPKIVEFICDFGGVAIESYRK